MESFQLFLCKCGQANLFFCVALLEKEEFAVHSLESRAVMAFTLPSYTRFHSEVENA